MPRYLPGRSPVPADMPGVGFASQSWMNWILRWIGSENNVKLSQTANFSAGPEFFYPCDATTGNITVTLPKANTQQGKKYSFKKTDSSANTVIITADTGVPDLIDGAATLTLTNQYDEALIVTDGISNWWVITKSIGGGSSSVALKSVVLTGTGNWTVPTGVTWAWADMIAGGGGGGGSRTNLASAAGGGGAGGWLRFAGQAVSGTVAYSVGAAGISGTAGTTVTSTDGGTGGNTSFGIYTVKGGVGGRREDGGGSTGNGGAGGGRLGPAGGSSGNPGTAGSVAVSEGILNLSGASGGGGGNASTAASGAGGASEDNAGGAAAGAAAANSASGGGGASSPYAVGGAGKVGVAGGGNAVNVGATDYGVGGGAGGGSTTGGGTSSPGGIGYLVVYYVG